jgi:hypothetical protein
MHYVFDYFTKTVLCRLGAQPFNINKHLKPIVHIFDAKKTLKLYYLNSICYAVFKQKSVRIIDFETKKNIIYGKRLQVATPRTWLSRCTKVKKTETPVFMQSVLLLSLYENKM